METKEASQRLILHLVYAPSHPYSIGQNKSYD